jgi:dTDP-L-rhamnose 4-epimerase
MTGGEHPSPRTVLVTGGAGFIGSHVVDRLLEAGHRVRVLDAYLPQAHGSAAGSAPAADDGSATWPGADVEVVRADVRDLAAVTTALDGVDVISHQAALVGLGVDLDDLDGYVGHNNLGTAVVLRAAAGRVGRIVLASSMVVYGEGRYRCAEHGVLPAPPRQAEDLAAGRFDPACAVCGRQLEPSSGAGDEPHEPRHR